MELHQAARRDRRQTWVLGIVFVVAIFVAGAPVIQAATQKVNVAKSVPIRVKDTGNGKIQATNIGTLGVLSAPGSDGALDVRTFGGGGGLLGTGDCDANDTPPDRPNEVTVPVGDGKTIITAIIVTGDDANVAVSAPELDLIIGPGPVANIRSTTSAPNAFIGLGNGLSVTPSRLEFECTAVGGGAGSGDFVILGQ